MWRSTTLVGRAIVELVADLGPDDLVPPAPATPGWTVADVLAHLAGVAVDMMNGNVAGTPGDEWTAKQVDDRHGRSLDELLAEWDDAMPKIEELIPHVPQLPVDVLTHEQDIRGALRRPGADADLLAFVLSGIRAVQTKSADEAGVSPPAVTASDFEWFRASLGRRSRTQVEAWDWKDRVRSVARQRLLHLRASPR